MAIFSIIMTALTILFVLFLIGPLILNVLALPFSEKLKEKRSKPHDIAAIITGYKDLEITLPLTESLLALDYPNFHVYHVADCCPNPGAHWYDVLHNPKLTFLRPNPDLKAKVRSLEYARKHFVRKHEAVVVFDADNLAPKDFFTGLDKYLRAGYVAVQGRRAAKNIDAVYAGADAAGELYKNYIERKVPWLLGSSSTIAGSGMAVLTPQFDAWLALDQLQKPLAAGKTVPAEDKVLQNYLVGNGHRIPFAWDVVLYDEKVETGDQVEKQRTRWIYQYFENIPYLILTFFKGLFRFDIINVGIISFMALIPPLVILVAASALIGLVDLFVDYRLFLLILGSGILFIANLIWTLYLAKAPDVAWSALKAVPRFAFRQLKATFKIGTVSKQEYLLTEKRKGIRIDDVKED
jgi:cellulose synthase/poly-beta-1,6-N-acetylglucosamine synthase-like glycosyltransferase